MLVHVCPQAPAPAAPAGTAVVIISSSKLLPQKLVLHRQSARYLFRLQPPVLPMADPLDADPRVLACYLDYPDLPSSESEHDSPWSRNFKKWHQKQNAAFGGFSAAATPAAAASASSTHEQTQESLSESSSLGLALSPETASPGLSQRSSWADTSPPSPSPEADSAEHTSAAQQVPEVTDAERSYLQDEHARSSASSGGMPPEVQEQLQEEIMILDQRRDMPTDVLAQLREEQSYLAAAWSALRRPCSSARLPSRTPGRGCLPFL